MHSDEISVNYTYAYLKKFSPAARILLHFIYVNFFSHTPSDIDICVNMKIRGQEKVTMMSFVPPRPLIRGRDIIV